MAGLVALPEITTAAFVHGVLVKRNKKKDNIKMSREWNILELPIAGCEKEMLREKDEKMEG